MMMINIQNSIHTHAFLSEYITYMCIFILSKTTSYTYFINAPPQPNPISFTSWKEGWVELTVTLLYRSKHVGTELLQCHLSSYLRPFQISPFSPPLFYSRLLDNELMLSLAIDSFWYKLTVSTDLYTRLIIVMLW